MRRTRLIVLALVAVGVLGLAARIQGAEERGPVKAASTFEGEKIGWRGRFDRYDFVMDEDALAIKPFKVEKDDNMGA
jgi:hypothetical protein